MATQTPIKYNSTNKKHELFSATDTVDVINVPQIPITGSVSGSDLTLSANGSTNAAINLTPAINAAELPNIAGVGITATGTKLRTIAINTAGSTSGQILTSAGVGVAPTWTTPSAGVSLSSTVPVQDAVTTGVIGVGTTAARADHVHPFTHSLVLTQAAGLVYTHDGDPKTVAIPTGVIAQDIGFDASGNPVRQTSNVVGVKHYTTSQSIPTATFVEVLFTSVEIMDGVVNSGNGFQVTTSGVYLLDCAVNYTSGQTWGNNSVPSASNVSSTNIVFVNGVAVAICGRSEFPAGTLSDAYSIGSSILKLNANDVVTIRIYHIANSAKTLNPSNGNYQQYFKIAKLV